MKCRFAVLNASIIITSAFVIAFAFLMFSKADDVKSVAALESPQWTQDAGTGITVPACGSSSASVTCSGDEPSVNFTWASSGDTAKVQCETARIETTIAGNPAVVILDDLPCSGSATWTDGASGTSYNYEVRYQTAIVAATCIESDPESGTCIRWATETRTYPRDELVCTAGDPESGTCFEWKAVTNKGHLINSGSFTTPNCVLFDYSLSNSGNITVTQGSSEFNTITATLATASIEPVSFAASGLPSGATPSFSPGSCNPTCSSTLTISTTVSTPAGTYPITVTGSPLGKTTVFNLVVNSLPPGDFTLSLGGPVACNAVLLTWTASSGADGYRILRESPRVDITPYNPYTALNFTDNTVSQNTSYRYQIEAYNGAGINRSNARNVNTPYCPPTLDFSGSPATIFEGQSSTLTWLSTFTTSCIASGAWSGSKGLNGSEIVIPLPPPSVTYNLQCSGPGGTTPVQPVTITITPLGLPGWKEIIPR